MELDRSTRLAQTFDRMVWQSDRMILDDVVFGLDTMTPGTLDPGTCFEFRKTQALVEQYRTFLLRIDPQVNRLLELGIWDGGSVALWNELLRPRKHIALDLKARMDSAYFGQYVAARGLQDRVQTIWGFDQADKVRLRKLIREEMDGAVDLILDDASHFYEPTLATFEAVFPFVEPGGLYVIEDWAWGHWPAFINEGGPWSEERTLTSLIWKLVEAAGTSTSIISSVTVYQGFVAIERGAMSVENPEAFTLESHIVRRPERRAGSRSLRERLRKLVAR